VLVELFRNVNSRRKFLLISVLLAVLGIQWFAAAHRGAHGAGRVLGLRAISASTIVTGVFDEHPAGGAECLRLDSVLGGQALAGAISQMALHEGQCHLEATPPRSNVLGVLRILPPARASPISLI